MEWGFGYPVRIRVETIDGRPTIVIGDRTRIKQMRVWIALLTLLFFVFGCAGLLPTSGTGSPSQIWGLRLGFGIALPVVCLGFMVRLLRSARREARKVLLAAFDEEGVLITTRRGERVALRQDLALHPGEMTRSFVIGSRSRHATVFLCELGMPLVPIVCTKASQRDRAEALFDELLGVGVDPSPISYWVDERTTHLTLRDPGLYAVTIEVTGSEDEHARPAVP